MDAKVSYMGLKNSVTNLFIKTSSQYAIYVKEIAQ